MKALRNSSYLALVALMALGISSCKEKDDPDRPSPDRKIASEGTYPTFMRLHGVEPKTLPAERYLGKCFDLVGHTANDAGGFTRWSVLDEKRIASNDPWSPFGRAITPTLRVPRHTELSVQPEDRSFKRTYQSSVDKPFSDSMVVAVGTGYEKVTCSYGNRRYSVGSLQRYVYRYTTGYKYLYERYDVADPMDYEFYLHKRFVRDLKVLSAAELVEKYGTHVVTSYSTGASQDLAVAANSSLFTESEVMAIHGALWVGGMPLFPELQKKVSNNYSQLGVTYLQSGSKYEPNLSSVIDLDHTVGRYDQRLFQEQINANAHTTFLELEEGNPSIPSLISDIPLKVKYFSGILDLIRPPRVASTMYVLSDPESYVMTPYKTKFLTVMLPRYESQQVFVYIGTGAYQLFEEEGRSMTRWYARMQETGLWTLQSIISRRFLCRDFVLRTAEEDSQNLRFWGLNPAIPTVNGNRYSLANLFIQH
jgi:MAC/Perforin domain.